MKEAKKIRFYYITEKNMEEIENDRSWALKIIVVIGILMLISV